MTAQFPTDYKAAHGAEEDPRRVAIDALINSAIWYGSRIATAVGDHHRAYLRRRTGEDFAAMQAVIDHLQRQVQDSQGIIDTLRAQVELVERGLAAALHERH